MGIVTEKAVPKRAEIKAVLEKDLDRFLDSLGIRVKMERGEFHCAVCGCKVTEKNLGTVYAEEREIKVCCSDLQCLNKTVTNRYNRR